MAGGFIDNLQGDSNAAKILEMMNKYFGDALKKF
jgi:hypothetical protein